MISLTTMSKEKKAEKSSTSLRRAGHSLASIEKQISQIQNAVSKSGVYGLIWIMTSGVTIKKASPTFAALVGVPSDELVGSDWTSFLHPVDRKKATVELMQLMVSDDSTKELPVRFRTKDDKFVLISWTSYIDKKTKQSVSTGVLV